MGNHTFTAQSAIVESIGAEEDLSVKPEGEEEAESSDKEDSQTLSGNGWSRSISQLCHPFCQCG